MDYREIQKSIRVQSKPLFDLSCAYEENCLSSTAARYVQFPHLFSRTLLRFTSRFWNRGTAPFLPFKEKGDWIWHECHQHYHSMERFTDYDLTSMYHVNNFYVLENGLLLSNHFFFLIYYKGNVIQYTPFGIIQPLRNAQGREGASRLCYKALWNMGGGGGLKYYRYVMLSKILCDV